MGLATQKFSRLLSSMCSLRGIIKVLLVLLHNSRFLSYDSREGL